MLVVPALVVGFTTYFNSYLGVRMKVLTVLLLLPSLCFADDMSIAITSRVLDWGQTRYVAQHSEKFNEMNHKMGDHPSIGTVNRHFSQLLGRDILLGSVLPPPFNHLYFGMATISEIKAIRHNRSIGVKFSF